MSSYPRQYEGGDGGRRYSTLEVPLSSSYRDSSRDRGRRPSNLEVPRDASRRPSRDSSAQGSTLEIVFSNPKEIYLPKSSGSTLETPQDTSRLNKRHHSTSELVQRSRSPRPVTGATKYRYSPLDPKVRRAIRVIRINDDLVAGKIAGEVEHTTTEIRYSALSYTWGSSKDASETIIINGHSLKVRRNLYAFLQHARENYAGKALWIDAICINQEDLKEKSRQVQMMSKIYSKTDEVLVWLGPREEHVGHTLRCMEKYEDMNDAQMTYACANDDEFWRGFKAINSASYWDRVWVIQEFVTPQKGHIIQGNRSISFETFQSTIRRFDKTIYRLVLKTWAFGPRRSDNFEDYMSNIHPLWQRRIHSNSSSSEEYDNKWTKLSGNRFCMDVRDRVYGIMPLATHGDSLRVDYNLNPFELLLESIWLEHDTATDRTEILMNLANILLLTPASICMYAQHRSSSGRRYLKMLGEDAEQVHLRAASSYAREDAWVLASANGKKVKWRNFAMDQRLKIPEGLMVFPNREQCPWQMFAWTHSGKYNVGMKLAIDAQSVPDKKGRVHERVERRKEMSGEEFVERNRKRALAVGVYETTCAPYPLKVFYSLVDGLEDVKGDHGAFMALDALDDFDLDLDL